MKRYPIPLYASRGTLEYLARCDKVPPMAQLRVIEDIVETGTSIDHMVSYLRTLNPRSIEVCTLFFKPEKYRYEQPIKYCAMEIGNEFIVGYGLDYDQIGRNLKDIYVVSNE